MPAKTGSRIIYRGHTGNVYEVVWKSVANTLRFDFNPMRHMKHAELKKLASVLWRKAYPDNKEKMKARKHRYYLRNKELVIAKQRERRRKPTE